MSRIEEIDALGEQILNQQALTDAKQLGLQACTIATQLATENERLTAELEKYRAAEQGGRLAVSPCKVGDTVYIIEVAINEIYEFQIKEFIIGGKGWIARMVDNNTIALPGDFGKTVFLTREAAEQALNEQKEHEPQ